MRIFHLSDLHLRAEGLLSRGLSQANAQLLDAFGSLRAELARRSEPCLVLITGDLCENGEEEGYEFLRSSLAELDVPYLLATGNHDSRVNFKKVFGSLLPLHPDQPYINYAFDYCGYRFLVLDTVVEGKSSGWIAAESLGWLDDQMKRSDGRPIILAFHHSFGQGDHWFMDQLPLKNSEELLQRLAPHRDAIKLLCCGHNHRAIIQNFGWTMASGPSTSFHLSESYSAEDEVKAYTHRPSYFVHTINDKGMSHRIQTVPEKGSTISIVSDWNSYISRIQNYGG